MQSQMDQTEMDQVTKDSLFLTITLILKQMNQVVVMNLFLGNAPIHFNFFQYSAAKRSYILRQTPNQNVQVCLGTHDLFRSRILERIKMNGSINRKRVKVEDFPIPFFAHIRQLFPKRLIF